MDESKKYIRTFAGDMETLKKGGTPNLAPLQEKTKEPLAQPPTPPTKPQPEEASAPTPLPKLTLIPPSSPTVQMPPVPAVRAPQSTLETYSGDFSDRMKDTKASTATVLAAEQDSAPIVEETPPKKTPLSSILYGIAGAILLIVSGIGVYIAYGRYLSASAPIIPAPAVAAPIFVDDRATVDGVGTALVRNIEQSVASPLKEGTVRLLYLENATTTSVFSALQSPAPGALLRNITAARSMAGVVNVGGTQSPFFILSVAAYGDTFAAMLFWEPTMVRDLSALFPQYSSATQTVSTSSPQAIATSTPVSVISFRDEVVANHDTRVYRDSAGRTVLLYGYWNQTTLVIASNAAAFTEIIGRLATSRAQ